MPDQINIRASRARRMEILGLLFVLLAVVIFLALVTDGNGGTPSRSRGDVAKTPNALGAPGAWLAWLLLALCGQGAHMVYLTACIWGTTLLRHVRLNMFPIRVTGLLLSTAMLSVLVHVQPQGSGQLATGGIIGTVLGNFLLPVLKTPGVTLLTAVLCLVGILVATAPPSLITTLGKSTRREPPTRESVAALMVARRGRSNQWATVLLLGVSIAHVVYARTSSSPVAPWVLIGASVLAVLLFLQDWVDGYRLRKGFFGDNRFEARRLIEFMLRESTRIDFTDSGKKKRLLPKPEVDTDCEVVPGMEGRRA